MESSTQLIDWQGYKIKVSCDEKSYNLSHCKGPNMIHFELRTIEPAKAPLPVTQTGYRSHFVHAVLVAEYANPIAFVQAWLDHAATENNWKKIEDAARQFCLF